MGILDSLSTTEWTPFGPAPIDAPGVGLGFAAGRLEAAAPHPTNATVMYVAACNGGIWQTRNWTHNPPAWTPRTDDQQSLQVGGYHCLAVHPAQPALVFAAASGHGAGVLRSANGGQSWQLRGNAL